VDWCDSGRLEQDMKTAKLSRQSAEVCGPPLLKGAAATKVVRVLPQLAKIKL
jgi:hypothetical protein